ncbi:MAG TPA: hypothetical protein EYM84_03795 [Flavobacteriales bacterium]|nr:hypothetical protein [Flavobacteriales bacterium]
MSEILSKSAIKGVIRLGDIIIPGDADLPSYSEFGGIEHVDDLLKYAPPSDIGDLNLILAILSFMPKFVLKWVVVKMTKSHRGGNGVSVIFRQLDLGLKGIILSTYYTEKGGANYQGVRPLDKIGYKINRILE